MRITLLVFGLCLAVGACEQKAPPPSAEPRSSATPAPAESGSAGAARAGGTIDPAVVEAATGIKPEVADGGLRCGGQRVGVAELFVEAVVVRYVRFANSSFASEVDI